MTISFRKRLKLLALKMLVKQINPFGGGKVALPETGRAVALIFSTPVRGAILCVQWPETGSKIILGSGTACLCGMPGKLGVGSCREDLSMLNFSRIELYPWESRISPQMTATYRGIRGLEVIWRQ